MNPKLHSFLAKVKNWKKIALVSIIINLALVAAGGSFAGYKIIQRINRGGGYLDNPQYAAYLSMFGLNDREADVFLGDSITARARYCEFFPETNVLNRGIGSDTSQGVLNRLEEVESHEPRAIFLMIGINDLGYGFPTDTTVNNVEDIICRLKEALPECRVYLESVLPAASVKLEAVEELNREYRKTADTYDNCTYVDLYPLFINEDGAVREEFISADGVHLNGAGYQAICKVLDRLVTMYR